MTKREREREVKSVALKQRQQTNKNAKEKHQTKTHQYEHAFLQPETVRRFFVPKSPFEASEPYGHSVFTWMCLGHTTRQRLFDMFLFCEMSSNGIGTVG